MISYANLMQNGSKTLIGQETVSLILHRLGEYLGPFLIWTVLKVLSVSRH